MDTSSLDTNGSTQSLSPCAKICKNCIWISELKHNFKVGSGYEQANCCTLFPDMIIQVDPECTCEEFFERVNGKELIRQWRFNNK